MDSIFPLAGALLVVLEVTGAAIKKTEKFLPIGGSHIAQIAVVFGLAFATYEVMAVLHVR
jgi:hypothetical protein